jgi:hypothetical protein
MASTAESCAAKAVIKQHRDIAVDFLAVRRTSQTADLGHFQIGNHQIDRLSGQQLTSLLSLCEVVTRYPSLINNISKNSHIDSSSSTTKFLVSLPFLGFQHVH